MPASSPPPAGSAPGALYICYFSLDEPLVQTQVLPYLRELASSGVRISLLTFERHRAARWSADTIAARRQALRAQGIDWHLSTYHAWPSLPATLWDVVVGAGRAALIARRQRLPLLHARSHVAAAMAMLARRLTGARVIFDIRGLLAEEYVDKGRWPADGALFRMTKRAERALLNGVDGFVVLTSRVRQVLFPAGTPRQQPLAVIPCCVDRRGLHQFSAADRRAVRAALGLTDGPLFVHAGTVGGGYLTDGTATLMAAAHERERVQLLILTRDSAAPLTEALARAGFPLTDCRVVSAEPSDVPRYLAASDVGLLFYRPSPASVATSPTKFAEYLSAGLPVIAATGIGDLDDHIEAHRVGVRVGHFHRDGCRDALARLDALQSDTGTASRCRDLARSHYDLQTIGGPAYRQLYEAVLDQR